MNNKNQRKKFQYLEVYTPWSWFYSLLHFVYVGIDNQFCYCGFFFIIMVIIIK